MLSAQNPPFKLAHISLFFAGLMWVFPFLDYYHAYPLTAFYQEWSAAVLGLAAMPLLATRAYWQRAEVPRVILLPVGMIVLVIVQFALGKLPYFGQMLLYTLYLMWAGLIMMLGRGLRDELGLPTVATALAVFLLAGAELSAAIGMLQHFGWEGPFNRVVTPKISQAVFGNVAQPNHYADYLAVGLASLGLLFARGILRAWHAALLALPILFVLPLTGSREIWFYLIYLVVASFLWQRRAAFSRSLWLYSLLILLGFGVMHLVSLLPGMAGSSDHVNSVQRLFAEDVNSGGIRLYLWREACLIFGQFPMLGAGFGQFAWQHFQLAPALRDVHISGLYNNAHNLVMQLAAEGGLAGLLILFGTLLLWMRGTWRAERSIYHWWGYAVLGVLAIHSMLEYPLWYMYFLGIGALLLGLLDETTFSLQLRRPGRVFVILVVMLGAVSLQQIFSGYRTYEYLDTLRPQSGREAEYLETYRRNLSDLQEYPLMQPFAGRFASALIEIGSEHIAEKVALNGVVMRYVPASGEVYRQSLLLAQAGDMAAAQEQMERAIWAYPWNVSETEQQLREMTGRDPGHFAALLEFALQKQQEYQRELHAVRGK